MQLLYLKLIVSLLMLSLSGAYADMLCKLVVKCPIFSCFFLFFFTIFFVFKFPIFLSLCAA